MPSKKKNNQREQRKNFQAPRGMHDILPVDAPYWEKIETAVKECAREHSFSRIETPVLEFADLYHKTTGEESDIVEKEMYTLRTKGDDVLALRPEYTPGICRSYLEHSLSRQGQPQKLFSFGPVFRHDRPQLGRYRQFTQMNFDVIGGLNDPIYDAEIVLMCVDILTGLKIKNPVLKLNSIGCRVCRPIYKRQLQTYYKNHEKELCGDCRRRLAANPLKLLDCKDESCEKLKEKAPNFLDKLCVTCSAHFKSVLEYLDEVRITYVLDNHLVRGLDYYSRTVFEMAADGEEEKLGALAGGGRYDYLMETIGGRLTPAVGFGSGVERLIAVMKAREIVVSRKPQKRIFLAHAGEPAKKKAFSLLKDLRGQGIMVVESLAKESLAAQLKFADKEKIGLALILGQREIFEKSVIVRDLTAGAQETIPFEKLLGEIKTRL
jgi:histidyl-tRNA synthetase